MKTVRLTIDEGLLKEVDAVAGSLGTTRSGFTREALRAALDRVKERKLERRQREGYRRKPVRRKEFKVWEREQVWGEERRAPTCPRTRSRPRTRSGSLGR